jgi:glutamyl/glutaminyl-tRNA synthetase
MYAVLKNIDIDSMDINYLYDLLVVIDDSNLSEVVKGTEFSVETVKFVIREIINKFNRAEEIGKIKYDE